MKLPKVSNLSLSRVGLYIAHLEGNVDLLGEFRPLRGINIVEMSHMVMGPACGMYLSFLGATVIKVEPPGGDKTRNLEGIGTPMFPLFNRGKQSVTLDIKTDEGMREMQQLLESADVLIENFKDGALDRMGLNEAALRSAYPELVICSHKGFLSGPYQARTALDEVVQMMTGLAFMTGPSGRPLRVGASVNDIMGGLFGAFAIMGALMERTGTGVGRSIRVGLFESCLQLVAQHMVQAELTGEAPPPMPERQQTWPVYDIFETLDGASIFVGVVTEGQWNGVCDALDLSELQRDPKLQSMLDRVKYRDEIIPLFAAAIGQRPSGKLHEILVEIGVAFAQVGTPVDMLSDPHVCREGGLFKSTATDGRSYSAPGLPFEIDERFIPISTDLPTAGQHNDQHFGELAQVRDRSAR